MSPYKLIAHSTQATLEIFNTSVRNLSTYNNNPYIIFIMYGDDTVRVC